MYSSRQGGHTPLIASTLGPEQSAIAPPIQPDDVDRRVAVRPQLGMRTRHRGIRTVAINQDRVAYTCRHGR